MLKSLINKSKNFFTKSSKKIVALTTTFVMLTTVMASAITVTESGPLLQYVPIKHHIYKGSRLKTYVMYANDGRLAYCLDFTKGTPSDDLQAGTKLNDAYYRALKNGYPYKSFTGDPNKDFYITQAAIWMVRGHFDGNDVGLIPSNLYPSNSDEQNIKNYAVNLFNQAISGSETPEPSISVSPKNSVAKIERDKYVAGPFNITSSGVQDFTVELNAPDGVQVLTAEGTSKASFNGTESFYIHIPLSIEVDQVSFNVRGNVKYQAPKSYLTAQSGKQNIVVLEEFITNTVSDSAVITYNQNGSIKLVKKGDNGKLLQGVKFQLKDESGKLVGEYVTDKNGEINISDIRKGNYTIEEVETVPGYLITTSSSDIVVMPGKTSSLEVVNKEITGELELTKTDISDGKLLPNTEFTIRNSNGEVVKTGITDENGIAKFNLTYGKYTYQETKAP
ncbi:MAG: SpaA isopeptide-forming pilin-related protein, partial [Clostridium sp.]